MEQEAMGQGADGGGLRLGAGIQGAKRRGRSVGFPEQL